MDLQLNGKKALVSGSSVGIGFAIAETLAREGVHVWVNSRKQQAVDEAVAKIKKSVPNAKVEGVVADLGTAQGVATVVAQVPAVDILVNNVGIFEPKEFEDITDEDWDRFFQVNVMSGVRLSRAYLGGMKKQDWGRIIFLSSESGIQIPKEMVHYGMTKTAQLAVARGIAESVAGTNITVNSVLPGPTKSEGVQDFVDALRKQNNQSEQEFEENFFKNVRPTSLIQRFATTEEVASMVAFVASPLAAAVNGASVRVDGGVVKAIC